MNYKHLFSQKTREIAQILLGRLIIRRLESNVYAAMISETGAYEGIAGADAEGPRRGMFYDAGNLFLMEHRGHKLLNIASGTSSPACVEIRELRGERRIEGAGAITNYLKIPAELDNVPLGEKSGVFISDEVYLSGKISCSDGPAGNCKGIYTLT